MNSSKKDISFICDGKESNIITLKPGYMITDVYSFMPVILDDGKKPIKDIYNCKWVTYMNDRYGANHYTRELRKFYQNIGIKP